MTLDADMLVDRRRLRRKLTVWRIVGIVALIGFVIALFYAFAADSDLVTKHRAHIARISVTGVIIEDRKRLKLIEKIGKSDSVSGVIVSINSPGGSTTGGEQLYNALRDLAEKKPVVAQIGTVGASAGYMTALAADHIVAHRTSLTGSIGVIMQYGEFSDLLKTLGIKFEEVKSSPLKAEPTFFKPTSPEARAMLQGLVTDSYDWFVGLVAERRGFAQDAAGKLADGRVFSGAQALDARLIDAIGGEKEAVAWLEKEKDVAEDLPIRDWKVDGRFEDLSLSETVAAMIVRAVGGEIAELGGGIAASMRDKVVLDGLVSLWQAETAGKNAAE
ncbi:MAG: signal peptide peptidase SppA [Hyphomicrobiales bacterium]|nr:MAG: signal peptide peptidase SppA [Hyphomicrobiales bacterium]